MAWVSSMESPLWNRTPPGPVFSVSIVQELRMSTKEEGTHQSESPPHFKDAALSQRANTLASFQQTQIHFEGFPKRVDFM